MTLIGYLILTSVHLEIVDFGSRQGRSPFETAVVVDLPRIAKGRERRIGLKDAISGWTLTKKPHPRGRGFLAVFTFKFLGYYSSSHESEYRVFPRITLVVLT